ncbi:hypothetical protein E2562_032312 [Oryza meyeriana var. granulata]|uniref:Uncharacterized protein n=1 Tax=Oryza meyeriana var. granulata TaxID=110450 RepID=A0A6G1ERU0_9ORYZ|nr:hypothetical protein E2562_032312 [Oryza meyeriana var. granulata]
MSQPEQTGNGSIEKFYKPASIEEAIQKNQKGANASQKSLQDNKKELERLFRDNDLNEMGYLKSAKGKKAEKVDGSFRAAVIECVTTLIVDEEIQDNIIEELNKYKEQQGNMVAESWHNYT